MKIYTFVTIILLCILSFLHITRLDVIVPKISFRFISPTNQELEVEYNFCFYEEDMIRGDKFGGFSCSDLANTKTGSIVTIPEKRLVSYWPFSKFNNVTMWGNQKDDNSTQCSWFVNLWSEYYESRLGADVKPEGHYNEYRLKDIKDKIIDIACR